MVGRERKKWKGGKEDSRKEERGEMVRWRKERGRKWKDNKVC